MISDLSAYLFFVLLELTTRGCLVLLVVVLLTTSVRSLSSASRYALWTLAFTGLFILPVYMKCGPTLQIYFSDVYSALPATLDGNGTSRIWDDLPRLGMLIWVIGSVLLGSRMFLAHLTAWRLARSEGRSIPTDWVKKIRQLTLQLKITRPVKLVCSDRTCVPMTCGLIRPSIVLPDEARAWSPGKLETVLRHELVHVRRWDTLVLLLLHTVRCIYWVNPLTWICVRKARMDQELSCDDEVVSFGANPSAYAASLIAFVQAARKQGFPTHVGLPMGEPLYLEDRVVRILSNERSRSTLTMGRILAAATIIVAGVLPVAACRIEPTPSTIPSSQIDTHLFVRHAQT